MPRIDQQRRPVGRGIILFSVNASWNVINFRAGLIRRLVEEGYIVTVAAPRDTFSPEIASLGCRYVELPMQPRSRSPLRDLALLGRYLRLIRTERPDVFLGLTPKPNIYGSIAAALLRRPTINNVAGLGTVFNERGPTSVIVKLLYRLALRRSACIFFQNTDDRALFLRERLVPAERTALLPGSGVDLARFAPVPAADPAGRPFRFLLVARLLREKGVAELVEAGRVLRAQGHAVEIRLLGQADEANSAFFQPTELAAWEREGAASWLGTVPDVRPHLAAADCVVLPSYYPEGTPRALLEAAAMAKPIITCDTSGCRDVVDDGVTGLLVPPRNVPALAAAMARIAGLPHAALAEMGRRGRAKVEREFDETIVCDRYIAALARIESNRPPSALA